MKFLIDSHCHTIASGHAYSTVKEYAKEAFKKGLEIIAITDHGPNMPGSTHLFYFQNLKILPKELFGVRILKGAEVNIIDYDGSLDLPNDVLNNLDFVIASLHGPCIKPQTEEINTRTIIEVMKNPHIDVIGHPDDSRVPLNYKELVEAAKEYNVMLEMNNSSLRPTSFRENARENYMEMLEECKNNNVPILLGTDSHFYTDVGEFDYVGKFLNEVGFPKELIVNTCIKGFIERIESKHKLTY